MTLARRSDHGKTNLKRAALFWVAHNVGVPVAYFAIKTCFKLSKVERITPEHGQMKPCVIAIWHGDLVVGAMELEKLLPQVDVLASRSRDGSLVARFVHLNKARTIRGGSSKGAAGALLGMRRSLLRGRKVIIPIDGPRGPFAQVKPGVIAVASQTGAPIIPGAVVCDKAWHFRSWDKAFVCKPFSRIRMIYGEPVYVPPDADREQIELSRMQLEESLHALHVKHSFPGR